MAQDTPLAVEENRCVECKKDLPAPGTRQCTACHSWQPPCERCSTCARTIPSEAEFCNECKSFQKGLRRYFNLSSTVLALIAALISVLSVLITQGAAVFHKHSQTVFKVTGANDILVHLKVWNNGSEPSTLLSYRLKFGELPIEAIPLYPKDAQEGRIILLPGKPVEVILEPYEKLMTTCRPGYDQPCRRAALLTQLNRTSVTLEMDVEESGHVWNLFTTRPYRLTEEDTFPGNIIYQFVEKTP